MDYIFLKNNKNEYCMVINRKKDFILKESYINVSYTLIKNLLKIEYFKKDGLVHETLEINKIKLGDLFQIKKQSNIKIIENSNSPICYYAYNKK